MSYKYVLHEDAQKDYEGSLEWYVQRSVRAAENFIKAVDNALTLIYFNREDQHQNKSVWRRNTGLAISKGFLCWTYIKAVMVK